MMANEGSARASRPMVTEHCWWCDEFTTKGHKQTGYCNAVMKPTWPSVVKQCRNDARANAGMFCWYCCPFTDEHEGYLCGDESPAVTNIHLCPEFNSTLNAALGGRSDYVFISINDQAEVVETYYGFYGTGDIVSSELTKEYRWLAGWQRYYPEVVV